MSNFPLGRLDRKTMVSPVLKHWRYIGFPPSLQCRECVYLCIDKCVHCCIVFHRFSDFLIKSQMKSFLFFFLWIFFIHICKYIDRAEVSLTGIVNTAVDVFNCQSCILRLWPIGQPRGPRFFSSGANVKGRRLVLFLNISVTLDFL